VTAAARGVPEELVRQLKLGGIMVLPTGVRHGEQRLVRVRRTGDGVSTEDLGKVRFVPLVPDAAEGARRRQGA
jgi:protein-L-isoaspartate(D-aspartate) O-methyltransferase